MSQFNNQRTDNLKIFRLNFSDINGRLDPLYYYSVNNLEIVNKTIHPIKKLSQVIDMQRGRFGHRPRNEPKLYGGEYPFIQTGDIVRASQSNGKITYSQTLNEFGLKTSRLFGKPVVVITIAANIGDTAILDYPACFPDSLIGMTPKTNELTLQYINLYFKFIKSYLEDLAPQSAQKNINYQQLSPVPIVVPPLDVQHKAVELYEKALQESQEQKQQAQALLASIDTYLLTELGITLPEQDNSLEKRMFRVSSGELSGGRFDATFHLDKFKNKIIIQSLYPASKIKSAFSFLSGYAFSSDDYVKNSSCVLITIKNIYENSIDISNSNFLPNTFYEIYSKFRVEHDDLVIAMTGATIGKVGIYKQPDFALLNQRNGIIRSKQNNTYYLMNLLNTKIYQELILLNSVGGAQPNISESAITNLIIPLPPIQKQHEIAEHIQTIRSQAKQLQTQAEQLLANAKAHIEQMILGV